MDIKKFIHMYGKHKVRVLDSGYITLRVGDIIQAGDQAYTWLSADCNELGWIPVPKANWHEVCTEETVEIRRKDVTAAYARTKPIKIQKCLACGNRFPSTQINCGECGYMM